MKVTTTLEREFDALLKLAPGVMVLLSPDYTVAAVNDACLRVWGDGRDSIVGRDLFQILAEADPAQKGCSIEEFRDSLNRVAKTKMPDRMPVRHDHPLCSHGRNQGSEKRYWSSVNYPRLDAEGQITHLVHQSDDVTEMVTAGRLNQNAAQVRADEEKNQFAVDAERELRIYQAALSNTPDLVYVFDLDHRFIYANEALLRLWGRSWPEAFGRNCLELGYEHWHASMHDREIEQVIATRLPIRGEVPFTGTAGRRIYDYIFVPVIGKNGTVEAVAGTTRDVTERKEAEEALRLSEQRFRITADHAPVLIWLCNPDKTCYWFNKPWLDFTGRSMEEELGDGWTRGVHPDDLDRIFRIFSAAVDERKPFTMEYRLLRHDGVYRWILDSGSPLFEADGVFKGLAGSCVDIHDRIQAEHALREADRRKDEFLAMLAHELRNPLAAVGNAVTVLRISNEPKSINFAKDVIERQVRQLVRLIDDLLDVSRITSGKIRLKRELCDAAAIINQAVESVQSLVAERGHSLEVELEPVPLPLRVDPIRVEQIFVNLLTNAAKYTERGGLIQLRASRVSDTVVIRIEDNGMGIPPEKLPEMFQLFSQGERSIARSEGGLGIGLTIVQKLTEMHGGRVLATSEGLGKGSCFTIILPVGRQASSQAQVEMPAAPLALRGCRILVAEDNTDMARGLAELLTLLGNQVEIAHNGRRCIDMARSLQPQVILLDIGLPGMDGYEVARQLRREEACRNSLIVAISGYGQEDDRRKSREAGFDRHLVKPVDFQSLVSLLETLPSV